MDLVIVAVTSLVPQAPVFLVMLVGIIVAAARWSRHPTVCALTVGGASLHLLASVAGTVVSVWLPYRLQGLGLTTAGVGTMLGVWRLVLGVVATGAWGLLLAAVFVDRRPPRDVVG